MILEEGHIYHIYNRGNNAQQIFFKSDNYLYFLEKLRKYILPHCDILAYALMTNHFHFLVYANQHSAKVVGNHQISRHAFNEGLRNFLSSYTQAINKQEKRTGSLFTQNTKFKCLNDSEDRDLYGLTCFHYIHQNPLEARLVTKLEGWPYSSFRDYAGQRKGTLCNRELSKKILTVNFDNFYQESYQVLDPEIIKKIF
jgi:putative transposase